MAWTAPRTWVTGEVVTASLMNTHVRDNLLQTGPAIVTAAGDILYATGANALARLASGTANQLLRQNSALTAPQWSSTPACSVYMSSHLNIAANTEVSAGFDSEFLDTEAMHNTVTNNSRITVVTAGKYLIGVDAVLDLTASPGWRVGFFKNGADFISPRRIFSDNGEATVASRMALHPFVAGDYIELRVKNQDTTAGRNVIGTSTGTAFFAMWISP